MGGRRGPRRLPRTKGLGTHPPHTPEAPKVQGPLLLQTFSGGRVLARASQNTPKRGSPRKAFGIRCLTLVVTLDNFWFLEKGFWYPFLTLLVIWTFGPTCLGPLAPRTFTEGPGPGPLPLWTCAAAPAPRPFQGWPREGPPGPGPGVAQLPWAVEGLWGWMALGAPAIQDFGIVCRALLNGDGQPSWLRSHDG